MSKSRKSKPKVERSAAKPAQIEISEKTFLRFQLISRGFDLAQTAFRWGGGVALAYVGVARPLESAAGKETIVNFVYTAALDMRLHMIVPYAAAALFGGLWLRERNLRRKTVGREHGRLAELEKRLDPGRTSSGLTTMGEDPKDRP